MDILTKVPLYLGIYVLLHFAYEATGWEILRPIAGTSESVFEHLKIGFFAYFFASLCEFALFRGRPSRPRGFWPSRILATWSVPWIIVSLWYLAHIFTESPLPLFLELTWAFVVTFLSGVFARFIERGIEDNRIAPEAKSAIFVLLCISLAFFVAFTYRTPLSDLFALSQTLHTLAGQ